MTFAEIEAAWEAGNTVQYLVVIGYDDEWTDYTGKTKPQEQAGRLVWRVKPADDVPEGVASASSSTPGVPVVLRRHHPNCAYAFLPNQPANCSCPPADGVDASRGGEHGVGEVPRG